MDNNFYDDFIRPLGDEYPAAIKVSGTRIPMEYETRFQRHYLETKPDVDLHIDVSRFFDGSASITLQQLKDEWSTWSNADQRDFCGSMHYLNMIGQQDFAETFRFLLQNADRDMLGPVVLYLPVGRVFPPDETFELLLDVLQRSCPGCAADVIRALGRTQHPEAGATIRRRLRLIVGDAATWLDASLFNKLAQEAAWAILSLLKLGASPAEFEEIVRRLSEHACERSREWCKRNFAKHYAWLSQ